MLFQMLALDCKACCYVPAIKLYSVYRYLVSGNPYLKSSSYADCMYLQLDQVVQLRLSVYLPSLQHAEPEIEYGKPTNLSPSISLRSELFEYLDYFGLFYLLKAQQFDLTYRLHLLYPFSKYYKSIQPNNPSNNHHITSPKLLLLPLSSLEHLLKSVTCAQSKTAPNLQNQNTIIEFDLQSFQINMADIIPDYNSSDEEEKPKENLNKKDQGANLTGWNELFLKDQLKRAIRQCGFEHPSEVQVEAIPLALQGQDILCQAKSGMGKTAVFVISILNQINPDGDNYQPHQAIITCHTRQLAHQIYKDFKRLGRYFKKPELRYGCYFGGVSLQENEAELKDPAKTPHIIISTPGRLYDLAKHKLIQFDKCKFFVVDECDKVLGNPKMRADIQDIFIKTPHHKQVMMFSATMPEEMKKDCKKFLQKESEIFIDEGKLILHGLAQFYVYINENKKFEKLTHLLDTLAFNQMIIFVNRVDRAKKLTQLLRQKLFNPICIHSQLKQQERIKNYDLFKANGSRLLVATDLFGRGIDIERVNLVINYDFPTDRDTYLHRVGRAGRFGTKGLAINFIRADQQENEEGGTDKSILMDVQNGFKVKISELPKELDTSLYM